MAVILVIVGLLLAFVGALFGMPLVVGLGLLFFIGALFLFARAARGGTWRRGYRHSRERTQERQEAQDGLPSRFRVPRR